MDAVPLTGGRGTIHIFMVATLVTEVVLDSYCCVTGWTYNRQRCIMDTSLSDDYWYNWVVPLLPFDAECMGSENIICKKSYKVAKTIKIVISLPCISFMV